MTKLKAIVFQMNQSHCSSPKKKKLPLIIILKHYLLRIYCVPCLAPGNPCRENGKMNKTVFYFKELVIWQDQINYQMV